MTQGSTNPGMVTLTPEFVVPVGQLNARLTSINQVPPPQQLALAATSFTPPSAAIHMPRPNPSLSNKGLVIVQVQNDRPGQQPPQQQQGSLAATTPTTCRLLPVVYDSVLKTSVCQEDGREEVDHHPQGLGLLLPGRPDSHAPVYPREDILSSATHQLIHGFPPFLHHHHHSADDDEEEEEDEDDDIHDDFDDQEYSPPPAEDQDEGYRTNSSSSFGGSPSSSVHSPAPREESAAQVGTVAVRSCSGGGGREEEEGSSNLMWLVDFKLDFFNDIEKNGERLGKDDCTVHCTILLIKM